MAADAERLRAQAKRIERLRTEKERRDARRITQETAAYEIGVSSRQYRTWEGAGATIKFENLQALAAYYDTSTGFIEYGQTDRGNTPELPAPQQAAASAERLAAIEERLAGIEEHLSELLGYRREAQEQLRNFDVEDAREFLNYLQEVRARQGRDPGRRALQSRRAAGQTAGPG